MGKLFREAYEYGLVLVVVLALLHWWVYAYQMVYLLLPVCAIFLLFILLLRRPNPFWEKIIDKIWHPWGSSDPKSMLGPYIGSLTFSTLLIIELVMYYGYRLFS